MNTKVLSVVSLTAAVVSGCSSETGQVALKPQPTEELFVAMPRGLPTECGPAVREAVTRYIKESPPGTPLNFFLADNQELLGSTTIPEGSKAYRRKVVKQDLSKVFERLDPEKTGGSQAVDLLSVPASIRKYRKRSDLKPRVVLIGSPLIEDREQGNSISSETLPCDGCVTDPESSYGKMTTFPDGTTVSWLTPRANYGNGPNHRGQVEHFLRYLLQEKRGPMSRMSSDSEVVFGSRESQWDAHVTPRDNCKGAKQVQEDEHDATLYDPKGDAKVVVFNPNLSAKVQPPSEGLLGGDKRRVLFLVDISGSVVHDIDGNDQSHIFKAIVADVCEKIDSMGFEQFAVCGFGAWADTSPRLPRHPQSVFSGFRWADATPESRERGIAFVRQLEPGGGTPTQAAIEQASQLEGPLTCLLYTDGVPTIGEGGQVTALEAAKTLGNAGVTINSVGVGALSAENEEFDWSGGEFLAELAQHTGGKYFVLESSPEQE